MSVVVDNDLQKLNREKIAELDKRHRERLEQVNAKHELSKQNNAVNESHDYFQETFRNLVSTIENDIADLKPNTDRNRLTQTIHKIQEDIQNVQNYLTASTFFLSNYTVKTCQTNLNDLKTQIEATKVKLLAKKKFNFRSKADASGLKDSTTSTVDAPTPARSASLTTPIDPVSTTKQDHFQWTVQDRQHEEIVLNSDETNNQDITVSMLDSCLLQIFGHPSSLQLSHLTNCVILCGPVCRSVFADNCTNCKFIFGCQQLRLHTSQHCDLYMHVTCRAIIEDCNNINVAPYNYEYANIDDDFAKAGLDTAKNNWNDLADFNWLSTDVQSPNWQQIASDQRISCWKDYLNEFRQKNSINLNLI